ncbi:MAG: DUF6798 domain-containing protein [Acidobacteriota bacterium]
MTLLPRLGLGTFFALLTALGLTLFPGHSYLLSDTQVYIPLFEHLRQPSLYPNELLLEGAHLAFTLYDEITLALPFPFEFSLFLQQFLFRWLGYIGAFLLARSAGFATGPAALASALLWLGAFVYGPAVVTTEFEPVPRGFAVPLVVATLGLLASGRPRLASVCFALAFLYHAPAVWPILLIALLLRHRPLLIAAALSGALLFTAAQFQHGLVSPQPFFAFIDPAHRAIQQTRAPYNWISLWPLRHILHCLLTAALATLAFRRLEHTLPPSVQPFFRWLPLIGLATMPLSWLGLELVGWSLFPQIQPMRALLYCHLLTLWLCPLAAAQSLSRRAWLEASAWLIVPLSLSLRGEIFLLPPSAIPPQLTLAALLLATTFLATRFSHRALPFALCLLLAPLYGEIFSARAFKPAETPSLSALSSWAQSNTPTSSIFLFPDLGRRLEPGIFRARARRTVYVCWKQGGQVNYFPAYAKQWWQRWSQLLAPNHPPHNFDDLRRRGIHFLVYTNSSPAASLPLVYSSPDYRVYQLTP